MVYLNTTESQGCGPGFTSVNTCLFYGRAAFRIWSQVIDAANPGFPGDPFRKVFDQTVHHEVGHLLGLQHNSNVDPMWGHSSYMRQGFKGSYETFFSCEIQKLSHYSFNSSGSLLTRYAATVDTANCND